MNVRFRYVVRDLHVAQACWDVVLGNPENLRLSSAGPRILRACRNRGFDAGRLRLNGFSPGRAPLHTGELPYEVLGIELTDDRATDVRSLASFIDEMVVAGRHGWF